MADDTVQEKEASNEGQRLLRIVEGTNQAIADELGVTRPIVSFWRAGKNRPGNDARRLLFQAFGIPVGAWDAPPAGTRIAAAPVTTPAAPAQHDKGDAATMSIKELLDRRIVHWGKMVDTEDEGIGPDARLRAGELERKCIAERRSLERDQRSHEADVVARSPEWANIRKRTLAVLRQFPDAFRAWTEAMGDLAREHGPIPVDEEDDDEV